MAPESFFTVQLRVMLRKV